MGQSQSSGPGGTSGTTASRSGTAVDDGDGNGNTNNINSRQQQRQQRNRTRSSSGERRRKGEGGAGTGSAGTGSAGERGGDGGSASAADPAADTAAAVADRGGTTGGGSSRRSSRRALARAAAAASAPASATAATTATTTTNNNNKKKGSSGAGKSRTEGTQRHVEEEAGAVASTSGGGEGGGTGKQPKTYNKNLSDFLGDPSSSDMIVPTRVGGTAAVAYNNYDDDDDSSGGMLGLLRRGGYDDDVDEEEEGGHGSDPSIAAIAEEDNGENPATPPPRIAATVVVATGVRNRAVIPSPLQQTPESSSASRPFVVGGSAGPTAVYCLTRRSSDFSAETGSTVSYMMEDDEEADMFDNSRRDNDLAERDFFPQPSREHEWMGRSVESLVLGHAARAPILHLADEDDDDAAAAEDYYAFRRRSTASTFGGGGYGRRRSSHGSYVAGGGRRGSLSLSGVPAPAGAGGAPGYHGGTMASYYNNRRRQVPTDVDRSYNERQGRRGSTTHTPMYRRRSSMAGAPGGAAGAAAVDPDNASARDGSSGAVGGKGGPNIVLTLMARENTGKSFFARGMPSTQRLRSMGGHALFSALDKPAAGIATEVVFLEAAIDTGDWTESQTIISRLAPRIIGDPMAAAAPQERSSSIDDPTLPPNASRFYAGGGRTGLERDAFVQAGGVEVLIRVFREKSFVGQEMAYSYDARDLSPEIVSARLAPCWNEALASLRELVFAIPSLVDERRISDNGEFLPFLFTLLSHHSCFDGAAALIEEILALLSQSPQQPTPSDADGASEPPAFQPVGRVSPPTTFFLGNVPDLYKLWGGFSCRQLAHFCRILALLIFEPEDRQILESPAVLKSLELLQLRRNRAVRAGRDSTVDMNQAILLGDHTLIKRLLMLLKVMNFAPALRRIAPYHVMAQYPFIADTLIMLGLGELESWSEVERQEGIARRLLEENAAPGEPELLLNELGGVADMLEGLSDTLSNAPNQIGHIIHVISAANDAGVIVGRGSRGRRGNRRNRPAPSNDPAPALEPSEEDQENAASALRLGGIPVDNTTIQGLASVAGILTDQVCPPTVLIFLC